MLSQTISYQVSNNQLRFSKFKFSRMFSTNQSGWLKIPDSYFRNCLLETATWYFGRVLMQ